MKNLKIAIALAASLAFATPALADQCPQFTNNAVLTAGQWQACFDAKQNTIGYTPLSIQGGTMLGRLVISAPTGNLGFLNLVPGPTPGSPANGDMWITTAGVFARVNGSTVGPFGGGVSSVFGRTNAVTAQTGDYTFAQLGGALTAAQLPAPFTSGTASGNTAKFATVTGAFTPGNCIKSDASGNFIDDGAVCGGGGGGGTPGGTNGQIQYNNLGAFGGFTASGDATINTATGAVAVSKTGGVAFATSATTDTTNASNIASGTLNTARLPAPFTSATASGSTSKFLTITGSQITNDCLKSDASGNATDAGAPCATVTSVGVTAGTGITQSGSPITTSGNITVGVDKAVASDVYSAVTNKVLTADVVFNSIGALKTPGGTAAAPTFDFHAGINWLFQTITATNFTLSNPTNADHVMQAGCIVIDQPASGTPVNITFGSNWVTAGGVSGKSLTLTLGARDAVCYQVLSTTSIWFTLVNDIKH